MKPNRLIPSPFTSWDDLRFFLATSETGSFSKAASHLGVSQPTMSRRIEQLEHHLGARLFDRLPDGVALTSEGEGILKAARQIEEKVLEIQRNIAGRDRRMEGKVRISVPDGLSTYWITPRLAAFQEKYPRILVEAFCSIEPADVVRMESDLSIDLRRPEKAKIVALKLGTLHFVPWASPAYLDRYGLPCAAEDLLSHRVLDHFADYDDEGDWSSWFALARAANVINYRTNSTTSLNAAIQNGLGIGLLPTYAGECATGIVPLDVGIRTRSYIWLTYHPGIRDIARMRAATDWVKGLFHPRATPWFRDEFCPPRVPQPGDLPLNNRILRHDTAERGHLRASRL